MTLGESLGFLAPALAGVVSTRAGMADGAQALLLVGAGAIEGALLGTGQARAFRLPLNRTRYVALSAFGAAAVWAVAMLVVQPSMSSHASPGTKAFVAVLRGVVGLMTLGTAQWLELRRHARRAHAWIGWTALAWLLALPLSFAPAPLVDESTAPSIDIALWASAGVLMAFVMALITWQGARRLSQA